MHTQHEMNAVLEDEPGTWRCSLVHACNDWNFAGSPNDRQPYLLPGRSSTAQRILQAPYDQKPQGTYPDFAGLRNTRSGRDTRVSAERGGGRRCRSGVRSMRNTAIFGCPALSDPEFPWTWIYAVYVEKAYNTKMRQVIDSQQVMKEDQQGNLFAERCSVCDAGLRRYAPDGGCAAGRRYHVVAVWRRNDCRSPAGGKHHLRHQVQAAWLRKSQKTNYKNGIHYELVSPIVPNVKCTLPHSIYMLGLGFYE